MKIETLFSTNGDERKTHLIIDGVDSCHTRWQNSFLAWDGGDEISLAQVELLKKGIDPDNRFCKWCMRKVVARLNQKESL